MRFIIIKTYKFISHIFTFNLLFDQELIHMNALNEQRFFLMMSEPPEKNRSHGTDVAIMVSMSLAINANVG